eukprot:TRINITY_DN45666_c0_g1_i1.p1 TRINITY_DN45666_c0_g1~~TRINITY_DN45666_c0_g1_i1.p1  ORF type:complete len:658 (+),score=170.09 TRINITY_DN45666_c0_g1_i1:162-2135(+)
MDLVNLPDLVEHLWRISIPLELVPDFTAVVFCALCGLWILRFIITWRPRLCLLCASSWLLWLVCQVLYNGADVLYETHRRWCRAFDVTENYAHALVELIRAWTDFFLPFLSDVARWVLRFVRSLSVRQRLGLCFAGISVYTVVEAFRFVKRHTRKIKTVLFHGSFLVGGPLIWYGSGLLSPEWLSSVLTQAITAVPAVLSALVLSRALLLRDASPKGARRAAARADGDEPSAGMAPMRLWLSYWSCWPLLAVLEAALDVLPSLVALSGSAPSLQFELRRAMLTLIVWLQFWQGSKLLQFTLESLLRSTSILDFVGNFGGRGVQLLRGLGGRGGGLGAAAASSRSSWRMIRWLSSMGSKLWMLGIGAVVVAMVLAVLVWLFYSAVSLMSRILTLAVWVFAALDTADTLANHVEDFYSKKLSFWVLATFWGAIASMPYTGAVLRIFTPVAFSLWLVAGEVVFKRALNPFVVKLDAAMASLVVLATGACSCKKNRKLKSGDLADEDEEYVFQDEDESEDYIFKDDDAQDQVESEPQLPETAPAIAAVEKAKEVEAEEPPSTPEAAPDPVDEQAGGCPSEADATVPAAAAADDDEGCTGGTNGGRDLEEDLAETRGLAPESGAADDVTATAPAAPEQEDEAVLRNRARSGNMSKAQRKKKR